MQSRIIWQYGSSDPENTTHLAAIRQWWAGLNGKEVNWRQRLLPGTVEASTLNWQPQRFDETFVLTQPELRGITLYWRKPDSAEERNTMPQKLELDNLRQQLYIFPKSQKELVLRVELTEVSYRSLNLQVNQCEYRSDSRTLLLRDDVQRLETVITLSPEALEQLKQQLG